MEKSDYLQVFSSHLRVADAARAGIIAELSSHLTELDPAQDVVGIMGDPKTLARSYNLAHLGRWQGVSWMFLTPAIGWLLFFLVWSRLREAGPDPDVSLSPLMHWWYSWGQATIAAIMLISVSGMVLTSLARLIRPWRTYIALLGLTLLVGTIVFARIEYQSRSGMLDSGRITIMPSDTLTESGFRDRITGQPIPVDQLRRYTVPVSVGAAIFSGFAMSFPITVIFLFPSYLYLRRVQRKIHRQP